MRRLIILVALALVASLILADAAAAQEETVMEQVQAPSGEATIEAQGPPGVVEPAAQQAEQQAEQPKMMEKTQPLPQSGGLGVGSVLLPAATLLLGSGVLAYAVLRRR